MVSWVKESSTKYVSSCGRFVVAKTGRRWRLTDRRLAHTYPPMHPEAPFTHAENLIDLLTEEK